MGSPPTIDDLLKRVETYGESIIIDNFAAIKRDSTFLLQPLSDGRDPLNALANVGSFGLTYLLILAVKWHSFKTFSAPSNNEDVSTTTATNSATGSPSKNSGGGNQSLLDDIMGVSFGKELIPEHSNANTSLSNGWEALVNPTNAFCASFTISHSEPFWELLHNLAVSIENICYHQPETSVGLLGTLLQHYLTINPKSSTSLTPIHRSLVYACYKSRQFRSASLVTDTDLTQVDTNFVDMSVHDYLVYHYYAALTNIELSNFDRATKFLNIVLAVPGTAVSELCVKAYQKLILIQLIRFGNDVELSKLISNQVQAALRNIPQAYTELVSVYQTLNPEQINNKVSEHEKQFTKDENVNLVSAALNRIYAHSIRRLTKVYSELSLSLISSRLGLNPSRAEDLENIHQQINSLVESHEINASVFREDDQSLYTSEHDATVRFEQTQVNYDTKQAQQAMHKIIQDLKYTRNLMDNQTWNIFLQDSFIKKAMVSSGVTDYSQSMADDEDDLSPYNSVGRPDLAGLDDDQ